MSYLFLKIFYTEKEKMEKIYIDIYILLFIVKDLQESFDLLQHLKS